MGIGENAEPIHIHFDKLRLLPSAILSERLDTAATNRGRKERKPAVRACKVMCSYFSAAMLSPADRGHLQFELFRQYDIRRYLRHRFPRSTPKKAFFERVVCLKDSQYIHKKQHRRGHQDEAVPRTEDDAGC